MPTYNCSDHLPMAINSILNQTYPKYELLIIDDGSTDNSIDVIKSFIDERIKFFKCEHRGIVEALNFGLKAAQNDLIGIMHSDDIAHPEWLETTLKVRQFHPEYDIISCWYACFTSNRIRYIVKTPEHHGKIKLGLTLYSLISHPGVTYDRKKIFKYSDGYSLEGGIEDYALWFELKDKVKFYNIQKVLMFYRLRKNSLSRNNKKKYKSTLYKFQDSFYTGLKEDFHLKDLEAISIRGWREYFYGEKKNARKFWLSSPMVFIIDYRISLAFILAVLPQQLVDKILEKRIRYRISYLGQYFSKNLKKLRVVFNRLISILYFY